MDSIKGFAPKTINVGGSCDIIAAVKDLADRGVPGMNVFAVIANNPAGVTRGSIEPGSEVTSESGTAVFSFTGTMRGTALIDLICGGKVDRVKIWVCRTVTDSILAMFNIVF